MVPKVGVEPTRVLPQWILNFLAEVLPVFVDVRSHLKTRQI